MTQIWCGCGAAQGALPRLTVLTLYGNAVEHHPAYRHVLVNRCEALKLLDFYLISDQELIEGLVLCGALLRAARGCAVRCGAAHHVCGGD